MTLSRVRIAIKLPLIVVALTVATALLTGAVAYFKSAADLRSATEAGLLALRESREAALRDFLEAVRLHVTSLARLSSTHAIAADLSVAWNELGAGDRDLVRILYNDEGDVAPSAALDASGAVIRYYGAHGRHHQDLARIAASHGYHDLFLVAADGDLYYTVKKERDFATNLLHGEWRGTGLARAFSSLRDGSAAGRIALVDFEAYGPSASALAGFMGTRLIDDAGGFAGAVLVQLPIDRINAILQQTAGMGETGETYLVGPDRLMRSDSRFTTISWLLRTRVDTDAVHAALDGERGVATVKGYRGAPVVSAYGPLDFLGVRWALLAEIEESEVLAPVADLHRFLLATSIAIALLAAALGLLFARSLTRPVATLTAAMGSLARDDASIEVPCRDRGDELGDMAGALQVFKANAAKRQQAEGALRESESQFRTVIANMPGVVYRTRLDGDGRWTPVYVSDQIEEITGFPSSRFSEPDGPSRFMRIVHPDDAPGAIARRAAATEAGDYFACSYRLTTASGEIRWVDERGKGTLVNGRPALIDATIVDVTERKLAEQAVAEAEAELRSTLENMSGSVFVVDADLRLQVWNDHFKELYAIPDELLREGAPLEELLRLRARRGEYGPGDPEELTRRRLAGYRDRSIVRVEDHVPGGRVLDVVRAPTGVDGTVVVSNDITDRKRMEEDLRRAMQAAEAANESKARFLANMSHEIRTPMNAIIGLSHLALGTELTDRQRDYLNKIDASAHNLLGIINDILDFSKIEAGRLEMESVAFDLREVLDNLAAVAGGKASEKGLELLFSIEPDLPMQLVGDPLRLGQVLINLTNNAVKFTDEGQIVISMSALDAAPGRARLHVEVRDSGIGMSDEQQQRLFQSFSQADASTTRKYGGTGLGLAITRQLVEMMSGSVEVESAPGEGSTFRFTVDLGRAPPAGQPATAASAPPVALEGLRVLIVDDNPVAREILCHYCERCGFRVDAVESGEQAVRAFEEPTGGDPHRLVLMDWKMPGIDGFEASRRIRDRAGPERRPAIVMVTAYGREDLVHEAHDLEGFLVKPVTPSSLLDSVMAAFGQRAVARGRRRSRGAEVAAQARGAHLLLAEDNEINQQVAVEVLEQAGLRVTVVENGEEAVSAVDGGVFDGILMDLQMPVMDGLTATRLIREDGRHRELPIIAMTANAMAGDRERCLAAGMNDHVAKPIDVGELLETLGRWVRASAPQATPARDRSADEDAPPSDLPGLDVADGLARVGGNARVYRRVLASFRNSQAGAPRAIEAALAANDRPTAERLAHTLKGVAGNLGAKELFGLAAVLEAGIRDGEDDLQPSLRATEAALGMLVAGIDGIARPEPAASPASLDHAAVAPLLDRLVLELEQFDAAATDTMDELGGLLRGTPLADESQALVACVQAFDFETACGHAQRLRAALAAAGDGTDGELAPLLDRLHELLDQSDVEAIAALEPIVERLAGGPHEQAARELAHRLEDFDFERAIADVERLARALGAPSAPVA